MNNLDPQVLSIVKGLMYTENGGKPKTPQKGKTGELASYFQYTPDTWDAYSEQVSGKKLPINLENETAVTYAKVKSWYDHDLSKGYTPEEATNRVASRWNAGEQKPDAYKYLKGVNKKYGVSYDTPAYAKKVSDYTKKFQSEPINQQPQDMAMSQPVQTPPPSQGQSGMIDNPQVAPTQNMTSQSGLITPPMKQARQV